MYLLLECICLMRTLQSTLANCGICFFFFDHYCKIAFIMQKNHSFIMLQKLLPSHSTITFKNQFHFSQKPNTNKKTIPQVKNSHCETVVSFCVRTITISWRNLTFKRTFHRQKRTTTQISTTTIIPANQDHCQVSSVPGKMRESQQRKSRRFNYTVFYFWNCLHAFVKQISFQIAVIGERDFFFSCYCSCHFRVTMSRPSFEETAKLYHRNVT